MSQRKKITVKIWNILKIIYYIQIFKVFLFRNTKIKTDWFKPHSQSDTRKTEKWGQRNKNGTVLKARGETDKRRSKKNFVFKKEAGKYLQN